ncbi:MAG: hypothetical protein KF812_06390 [Fimbriimonadaceae bacterium]|nr:hypothetical protein [Fimbriimonadaceae bacterium]
MTLALASALQQRAYMQPETLCTIDDTRITESSGIGASPSQDGVFFTHNDSGDSARFFRFDRTGLVRAEFTLRGVRAIDWEDMAVVRIAGTNYIYLADVGDNAESRTAVQIYRVNEPTEQRSTEIATYQKYVITYEDKPHNCEGFFVDPQNGDFYLVTKSATGSEVFQVKAPPRSGNYTARKLGDLRISTGGLGGNLVTGADISPNGKFVIVRTYSGAREYPVIGRVHDWFKQSFVSVALPAEMQGEAICYSRDGLALITSTEGKPTPISIIGLRR